jgi:hypothetical protein
MHSPAVPYVDRVVGHIGDVVVEDDGSFYIRAEDCGMVKEIPADSMDAIVSHDELAINLTRIMRVMGITLNAPSEDRSTGTVSKYIRTYSNIPGAETGAGEHCIGVIPNPQGILAKMCKDIVIEGDTF